MKKLFLLILLTLSFNAFAFDYHGIKSGMDSATVQSMTGCNRSDRCVVSEVGKGSIFNTRMGINPPNLALVGFKYTTDDKLWRIALHFDRLSFQRADAQQKALEELYDHVKENTVTINVYPIPPFDHELNTALLIDDELYDQDVAKIYSEKIGKY